MPRRRPSPWIPTGSLLLACAVGFASPALAQDPPPPQAANAATADTPAHRQFLFAYKLMRRGELAEAADEFRRHLRDFPDAPKRGDSIYYLALILRNQGQPAEAERLLRTAPDPALIEPDRANLLRGQVLMDAGELDMAVAVLERIADDPAAEPTPIASSAAYLLGRAYRQLGNQPAALARLERAAQGPPALRATVALEIARLHAQAGDLPAARAALTAQADPDRPADTSPAALLLAGRLAAADNDPAQAQRLFEALLAAHPEAPERPQATAGLIQALHQAGQDQAALQAFDQRQRELSGAPRIAAVYAAGTSAQRLGDHALAVRLLGSVAAVDATHELADDVLLRLSLSQRELGQNDALARTVGELRRSHPESPLLIDAAFVEAAAQGPGPGQIAAVTGLVERGPNYPYHRQALLRRATAYREAGRPEPALADLEAFLAFDPAAHPGAAPLDEGAATAAQLQAVELRLALGRTDAALASSRALVEDAELDPDARRRAVLLYAEALRASGDASGALEVLTVLDDAGGDDALASAARFRRGLLEMRVGDPGNGAALLRQAGDDEGLSAAQRVLALRIAGSHERERSADLLGDPRAQAVNAAAESLRLAVALRGAGVLEIEEALWLAEQEILAASADAARALAQSVATRNATAADQGRAALLLAEADRIDGRLDQAIAGFDALAKASQGDPAVRDTAARRQAELLIDLGRPADAVAALESAVQRSAEAPPASASATLGLFGRAHLVWAREARLAGEPDAARQRLVEARRALKRVVTLYGGSGATAVRPGPQLALLDLAEVEAELGQTDAAAQALQDLAAAEADAPFGVLAQALLDAAAGRTGRAEARMRALDDAALADDPALRQRVERARRMISGESER
ncbi:MAG: tetratricopeptide repeat protein [Planctomycetota bacterium]